ncbi:uncharacterized protein LOC132608205 [Lycium barbarum]|uniref:uncharacterized protein LOC132608205 n=1 Tax=Lycium barbarum TaxID=112863 RepID=UPI00293EF3BA|nr:uncharacterized protein LOC132608205 [Lycium barbarum]
MGTCSLAVAGSTIQADDTIPTGSSAVAQLQGTDREPGSLYYLVDSYILSIGIRAGSFYKKAKKILVYGIGPDEYNHISSCESAKEIWDTLQTAHEGTSQLKRQQDLEKREPIKEKILVLKAAAKSQFSDDESDMAYLTRRFQKMVRKYGGFQRKGNTSKISKGNDRCHKCGKPGHFIKECPLHKQDYYKNTLKKQQRGTCFLIENSKEEKQLTTWCRAVHAYKTTRCNTLAAWIDPSSESEDEDDQGDASIMAVDDGPSKYESIFALMAKSDDGDDNEDEARVSGSNQKWYMDSGCSKHMTENMQNFLSLKAFQGWSVSFGNGKKDCILGIRKIGKTQSHAIENVYYVDGLKYNLLSVSQICDRGNEVNSHTVPTLSPTSNMEKWS